MTCHNERVARGRRHAEQKRHKKKEKEREKDKDRHKLKDEPVSRERHDDALGVSQADHWILSDHTQSHRAFTKSQHVSHA